MTKRAGFHVSNVLDTFFRDPCVKAWDRESPNVARKSPGSGIGCFSLSPYPVPRDDLQLRNDL